VNIDELLSRLERVRRRSSGWTARCPAHDDRNPSLSVCVAEDGRILVHCHAGCTADAVVAKLGLELRDLSPRGEGGGLSRRAAAGLSGLYGLTASRCIPPVG
jgi:hypothetical protein